MGAACAWDGHADALGAPILIFAAFPTSPERPDIHMSVHHRATSKAQPLQYPHTSINL